MASFPACDRGSNDATREVVVYTALDQEFSQPILDEFTRQTGIRALPVYDTESTKSVGLATRIRAEAARPRCDVYWNNEILNTLRLKADGLLQPCRPKNAAQYPAEFRDAEGYWYGFAARARIIIVNTTLLKPDEYPRSIRDLALERFRGRAGIAKPLFGTTASHAACLFAALGPQPARELLLSLKANEIQVLGGNKACAEMVAAGKLAAALTDTDDAVIERDAGKPVAIIFPDGSGDGNAGPGGESAIIDPSGESAMIDPSGGSATMNRGGGSGIMDRRREIRGTSRGTETGMGTPVFPNTLAVVKGAPHAADAERLIDFLLSPEVEARLAAGPSAQIPLGRSCPARSRVGGPSDFKAMSVDFAQAAAAFDEAARLVESQFLK